MPPGSFGLSGISMIDLKRGDTSYLTDRLAQTGVDAADIPDVVIALLVRYESLGDKCLGIVGRSF